MSQDSVFEKLEQLVKDENRIVTYKILSREMKLHVNKAKEYLNLFFTNHKSNDGLVAYYFLAGFYGKDGKEAVKVLIVPDDKLEESKQEFREITSCHIYSLSRVRIKDECALYTADVPYNRETGEQKKYAAIKHPCLQVQDPVLNKIDVKYDVKNSDQKNQNVALGNSSSSAAVTKNKCSNGTVEQASHLSAKDQIEPKSENLSNLKESKKTLDDKKKVKQNTLASLWQKKEETSSVSKKENSKSVEKGKKAPVKNGGKGSIMSMFSKQAEKNAIVGKREESIPLPKQEVVISKMETEESPTIPPKSDTASFKASQKRKSTKKQSSKKLKEPIDSDSGEEIHSKKKKRRRICTFEDSEDSESENEEVLDKAQRNLLNLNDEIPSTPAAASDDSEEPIPPTPPIHNSIKIKGKVWKSVQKTYQDEDGFFVTKKEKELVSEDSDEDPLKPKDKKPSPKKSSPIKTLSTNRKQASLTNYFRQK